jgi:hypothetical protein
MTNALLGYDNKLATGTLSASTDPAAAPKENAIDWRLDDYWQPTAATSHYLEVDLGSAASVDYFAFYSSDLFDQAGAQVELFGGGSPAPSTSKGTFSPTTRGPKFKAVTADSNRYWRLEFSTTGSYSPKIQMVALGLRLELQRGLGTNFEPPALAGRLKPQTNISETGVFLGRSLEVAPAAFKMPTTILTPAWIRSNWPALLAHIERYPFFVLPEPDSYPDEAVIAWTKGKISQPKYSHANLMSLNLSLQAFL